MYQVSAEQFEAFVADAVKAIPPEFQKELSNVVVMVEQQPTRQQLIKLQLRPGHHTLFGLYEGISLPRRSSGYSAVLPDKITIFQQPMQWVATTEAELKQMVADTVWHEFAHYFGMNEDEVRAAEKERQRRISSAG
jgi:predicted Zn-dependent protease with MMP-like domain